MDELPVFKYSPNAYAIDVFEQEGGVCSVCNQQRLVRYTGSFYSIHEPAYICPWCVADGGAARTYNGVFNGDAGIEIPLFGYEEVAAKKALFDARAKEVAERTPGYISWQQEVWLSHCGEPCAFLGDADSETIAPIFEEIAEDIYRMEYDRDIVAQYLTKGHGLSGYLFRCLHCGVHRLHIDST